MHLNQNEAKLIHFLKSHENKRLLFVGIGNLLRQDDGLGVYICKRIQNSNRVSTLNVEVSIENYIGKINSIQPEVLVLIDCVNFGMQPGYFDLLSIDMIHDTTFNTHNISLNRLSDFFKMPTFVIGIQPQNIDFGETLTSIVEESANRLITLINNKEVCYG